MRNNALESLFAWTKLDKCSLTPCKSVVHFSTTWTPTVQKVGHFLSNPHPLNVLKISELRGRCPVLSTLLRCASFRTSARYADFGRVLSWTVWKFSRVQKTTNK